MFMTPSVTTSYVRNTNYYIMRQQIEMDIENTKAEAIFAQNVRQENCVQPMQRTKK